MFYADFCTVPVSAMHHEQSAYMAELCDGKVCCQRRLFALLQQQQQKTGLYTINP